MRPLLRFWSVVFAAATHAALRALGADDDVDGLARVEWGAFEGAVGPDGAEPRSGNACSQPAVLPALPCGDAGVGVAVRSEEHGAKVQPLGAFGDCGADIFAVCGFAAADQRFDAKEKRREIEDLNQEVSPRAQ